MVADVARGGDDLAIEELALAAQRAFDVGPGLLEEPRAEQVAEVGPAYLLR